MKKLIATGTVAALLLAASSAPALAQVESDVSVDGDDNTTTTNTAQFVDASQWQFAAQGQFGDANAEGDEAVAEVSSEQDITQQQVNAGLGEIDDLNQGGEDAGDLLFFASPWISLAIAKPPPRSTPIAITVHTRAILRM